MTIKELIEIASRFDGNKEVVIYIGADSQAVKMNNAVVNVTGATDNNGHLVLVAE